MCTFVYSFLTLQICQVTVNSPDVGYRMQILYGNNVYKPNLVTFCSSPILLTAFPENFPSKLDALRASGCQKLHSSKIESPYEGSHPGMKLQGSKVSTRTSNFAQSLH